MAPSASPIARVTRACIDQFSSTCAAFRELEGQGVDGITYHKICDTRDRFMIWASNIGALQHQGLTTSLDYRLRGSRDISNRVTSLLVNLGKVLEGVRSIASGNRQNRVSSLSDYEEFLPPQNSEDPIEVEADKAATVSEIQELFSSAADSISHLFRLSTLIRSATARDRYARAAAADTEPFGDQYDIAHVRHKFPKLDNNEKEWLVLRLGKAITWRRQYFRYAREHQQKLSFMKFDLDTSEEPTQLAERTPQPRPSSYHLVAPSIAPSQLAPTTASTMVANTVELLQPPEDSRSQVSFATTVNESTMPNINQIMSLERASEGQEDFVCPYCWSFQRHTRESSWRKHVLTDLRPYICTFKDCSLKLFQDRHSWFEHEMQNHKFEWRCNFCSQTLADSKFEFHSTKDFECHLLSQHEKKVPRALLPVMIQASQYLPHKISPESCPFCDEWVYTLRATNPSPPGEDLVVTPEQFMKHVGNHLAELALFALPRSLGDESAPSSDAAIDLDTQKSSLEKASFHTFQSHQSASLVGDQLMELRDPSQRIVQDNIEESSNVAGQNSQDLPPTQTQTPTQTHGEEGAGVSGHDPDGVRGSGRLGPFEERNRLTFHNTEKMEAMLERSRRDRKNDNYTILSRFLNRES